MSCFQFFPHFPELRRPQVDVFVGLSNCHFLVPCFGIFFRLVAEVSGRKRERKKKGREEGVKRRKKFLRTTRKRPAESSLQGLAKKLRRMEKTIETKIGVRTIADGQEYLHNNLYNISSGFLVTNNGTMDIENTLGQHIGDKITLVGVSFTMMVELNERYSDVTFRMFVVRSAKGDTPTTGTLWQGASSNKMLDTFNTERFSILHSKYVKLNGAPFFG